jgi:hypothetical protein
VIDDTGGVNIPTVTRLCNWLIFMATPALVAAAPAGGSAAKAPKFHVGHIDAPEVAECSALVASRRHDGVFWSICDSGNAPALYALTREGKLLASFPVDATNVDWEDLATDDDGHLYIAETGNNEHRRRPAVIYRVDEPDPAKPPPKPGEKRPALPVNKTWRLEFPEPTDCEALFIHHGRGYLIPKLLKAQQPVLYSFPLEGANGDAAGKLRPIGPLPVRTPVTAAGVSDDGKWLAILTITGPTLVRIDGDPAAATKAGATTKSVFFVSPNMEACCFVKEGLLAATEGRDMYLFRWEHFGLE